MKTSAVLIIKSAKELLVKYQKGKKDSERVKKNIIKMLKSIPNSESQLHKEKIDAIIKKL